MCVPTPLDSTRADDRLTILYQLLRPEVERRYPLWAWLGTACGAGLGFITANVPGLVVGAGAGNRLGAIRDAKGKSVAAVFEDFSSAQKAEVRRKSCVAPNVTLALICSIDRYCAFSH